MERPFPPSPAVSVDALVKNCDVASTSTAAAPGCAGIVLNTMLSVAFAPRPPRMLLSNTATLLPAATIKPTSGNAGFWPSPPRSVHRAKETSAQFDTRAPTLPVLAETIVVSAMRTLPAQFVTSTGVEPFRSEKPDTEHVWPAGKSRT